jgi:hypothetical protein
MHPASVWNYQRPMTRMSTWPIVIHRIYIKNGIGNNVCKTRRHCIIPLNLEFLVELSLVLFLVLFLIISIPVCEYSYSLVIRQRRRKTRIYSVTIGNDRTSNSQMRSTKISAGRSRCYSLHERSDIAMISTRISISQHRQHRFYLNLSRNIGLVLMF